MTNPVGKDDSERERTEPSDAGNNNAEVEHESFPSLTTESVSVEAAQLDKEANLGGISNSVGSSVDEDATQEIPMDIDMPSESTVTVAALSGSVNPLETVSAQNAVADTKNDKENDLHNEQKGAGGRQFETDISADENNHHTEALLSVNQEGFGGGKPTQAVGFNQSFSFDPNYGDGGDSGAEEEQVAFMKELENFFKERSWEFKPPKFYGEGLNCLKLWRTVTRLGGYDQVTSCKLWRQVGESFKPPKTCTTVSWSFRCFYEKALLEYEKHKVRTGELQVPVSSFSEPITVDNQALLEYEKHKVRTGELQVPVSSFQEPMTVDNQGGGNQASGPGRARRDAAARAMQGWHSQRMLGNGEVGDPVIKDKVPISLMKREKNLKSTAAFKKKKSSSMERAAKVAHSKLGKPQADLMVVDVGSPADWVKINVRTMKDCFEVYALVPGLLREEVHVQSDPAGRLIISGEPEQPDNPWGVTPFKKVITLPSRIDPHQTSAVVTLHGQLFVRAPFEQIDL